MILAKIFHATNTFILMQSIYCRIIFHFFHNPPCPLTGQFEVIYCTTNITNLAKLVDRSLSVFALLIKLTVNLNSFSELRVMMVLNGWVCIHWTEIGKLDPRDQPNVCIILHLHACRAEPSRSNPPLRLQSCCECCSRQSRSESRTSWNNNTEAGGERAKETDCTVVSHSGCRKPNKNIHITAVDFNYMPTFHCLIWIIHKYCMLSYEVFPEIYDINNY